MSIGEIGFVNRIKVKAEKALLRMFPNTVQTTLILYFVVVIVVPLFFLGIITYTVSSRTITHKVQVYIEQVIIKVKENIEYYFKDLQSLSYVISVNSDVLTVLRDEAGIDGWKEINYQNKLTSFLAGLTSTRVEVRGIYIISRSKKRVYSSGPPVLISNLKNQEWYKKIVNSEMGMAVTGIHSDDYTGLSTVTPGTVVTYAQRIYDLDGKDDLGWILIDLDYGFVTKMLENIELWDQGTITIFDAGGRVIFGEHLTAETSRSGLLRYLYLRDWGSYLQNLNGTQFLLVFQTVSLCDWKVIFSIPYRVLQRENIFIRNLTIFLALALLITAIYIAVLFSRKIAEPVKLLCDSMREVEKGNLDVKIKIWSMNEFNELAGSFNHMVEKIRGLMNNISEAYTKKEQAELDVLQAQINPHFLYNTLDSLRWLAKIRNVEEISEVISALENLLRASISKTDKMITIGQELENVRNYLAIQLFRYGNSFSVNYHLDPLALEYLTPRLILQPIVENAIYHGIEGLGNGEIQINVYSEPGSVCFEVIDNGRGIEPEKARLIMEGKVESNQRFSGLGIKNVDDRIKLNFGAGFGVRIEQHDAPGTKVIIRIPCIRMFEKRKHWK
ncbi:MAG: cache domain-containing sensor histidine kinase [Bacillota bacterium]